MKCFHILLAFILSVQPAFMRTQAMAACELEAASARVKIVCPMSGGECCCSQEKMNGCDCSGTPQESLPTPERTSKVSLENSVLLNVPAVLIAWITTWQRVPCGAFVLRSVLPLQSVTSIQSLLCIWRT